MRRRHAPLSEFVAGAVRTPFLFEPGTRYEYSSMAILLAAARTRLLSPRALLARLDDSLALGSQQADLPERQQTLLRQIAAAPTSPVRLAQRAEIMLRAFDGEENQAIAQAIDLDPTAVDARADLFSLGIVMWEALVGDFPYQWENKRDLLSKVMHGKLERHPAARRPDVPEWLDAIVARVLAHDKNERFESALAMKDALEKREPPKKPGLLGRIFGT